MIPLVYKGILLKNAMGFNRTFMELKLLYGGGVHILCVRFNRTFMELKLQGIIEQPESHEVLIGPSWN